MPEETTWTRPEGGMSIWVTLPPGFDAGELLIHVREHGVLFVPGRYFYLQTPQLNTLRLGFAGLDEKRIARGVQTARRSAENRVSQTPTRRAQRIACRAWRWSDPEAMLLTPNPTNSCFGCGGANPRSMLLTFEQDDATQHIRGNFRLGAEYQGGGGFIHGGIIALVLDEAMGKVNRFKNVRAVTAEITIEYIRPFRSTKIWSSRRTKWNRTAAATITSAKSAIAKAKF